MLRVLLGGTLRLHTAIYAEEERLMYFDAAARRPFRRYDYISAFIYYRDELR